MSVIFSTGSFEQEVAAALFADDGRLTLLAHDGTISALGFGLPEMPPASAHRLKIYGSAGVQLAVYEVSEHEFRQVATLEREEFLYPWRQDGQLVLMRADEEKERDVSHYHEGVGWSGRGPVSAAFGNLVVSDPDTFARTWRGSLSPLVPVVAPLGPRSRPSGVAERVA